MSLPLEGELVRLERRLHKGGLLVDPLDEPFEDDVGGAGVAAQLRQLVQDLSEAVELRHVGLEQDQVARVQGVQVLVEELLRHLLVERLFAIVVAREQGGNEHRDGAVFLDGFGVERL